jgi:hypothetical protein
MGKRGGRGGRGGKRGGGAPRGGGRSGDNARESQWSTFEPVNMTNNKFEEYYKVCLFEVLASTCKETES